MMEIRRHETALKRSNFSRPVRLAIEANLINTERTVFDYGCGHGGDVERLTKIGVDCFGWDPIYQPHAEQRDADVVNLGYVVNVIEDPEEREQALKKAWSFTHYVLVVSARLDLETKGYNQKQYGDGYVTQKNTFQKYYLQSELRDWINQVIEVESVAIAPGVFLAFRHEEDRQAFLASRQQRQLRFSFPKQKHQSQFEQHQELLQPLTDFMSNKGRIPAGEEIDNVDNICQVFGSLKRAGNIIRHTIGQEEWERIQQERSQDFLVYLALQKFVGRPRFSMLPDDLKLDIKAFWRNYTQACKEADEVLFSTGDVNIIDLACRKSPFGKLTPEALYIHTSGLSQMPPILRIYEGCAANYIGIVEEANIIKLHRKTSRISYLSYPDFDRNPHPALTSSVLVDLQKLDVVYRDYSQSKNPPILHRKETFVPTEHPSREKFERLTRQEERWGLFDHATSIGTREKWQQLLNQKGVRLAGHRLMRQK